MVVKLNNEILFEVPPLPMKMSNKELIGELCKVIERLLQGFPVADRVKFAWGRSGVSKSVVHAFYNVGKSSRLLMKDVGIDYETCRKMLTQCIEWSAPLKLVTPQIALMAHHKFVGDTTGHHSPVINLVEETAKFGDRVARTMEQGYMDELLDIQPLMSSPTVIRQGLTSHNTGFAWTSSGLGRS